MFDIELTPEAVEDIRLLRKFDMERVINGIETQLKFQPMQETRDRKRLRPNKMAEWELRIDKFRVFYDVNQENKSVKVEAVGYKKGNRLFIHGEEYQL
jgi:mRNA-degrading endonuclease RelE of RelBE toxin-antitoxin system